MQISQIINQIDIGAMTLPVFQRGYVWKRNQVRDFMQSLYRRHPVGSLLIWKTRTENITYRGEGRIQEGYASLILDGQQRITSLYGIMCGKAPPFFEGNAQAFTGLYFNVRTEDFQFYAPSRMGKDSGWVSVTELMQDGMGNFYSMISQEPDDDSRKMVFERLSAVASIGDINLHIEEVTGEEKTVDTVVDIFNRVNSGGTKLSKGDLALAKVSASWPNARDEMNARLIRWKKAGFSFSLEWLLRCMNTIATGEARYHALNNIDTTEIVDGLHRAERHVDYLLNLVSSRLGLDHQYVLKSPYSFPLMVRYLDDRGGTLSDPRERDRLLFWYVHTMLWGRFSASTESVLDQDLEAISDMDAGLQRLIDGLRRNRGDLRIAPDDFDDWRVSARFYPLLYMMTRVNHSVDWDTGIELSQHTLGRFSSLHLHHIFPKSLLYKHKYEMREVNALANFTFLTQDTNLKISNRDPSQYIPEIAENQPGALESHWIPMDPELWKIEKYRDFLQARWHLLAQASNEFLNVLLEGPPPEINLVEASILTSGGPLGSIKSTDEEDLLLDTNIWVVEQGLPEGEMGYQLVDEQTENLIAILDLAWPDGLQQGLSQPVALLIDEEIEVERLANRAGFLTYTSVDSLKQYVQQEILATSIAV